MSIEEFRKIKEEIAILFEEADSYGSTITEEQEINFVNRYINVVNNLLDSDLSNIPFEEWKGLELFTVDGYLDTLDFSKTHANLDFKIFESENIEGANFTGCNIKNLEYFDSYSLDDYVFDENTINNNPLVFKEPDLPEDEMKMLRGNITFEYLYGHPEVRPYVLPSSFRYGVSKNFIQKLGFDNAIKFYDEHKEFVKKILYSLEFNYGNNLLDNLDDLSNLSYEDALKSFYTAIHTYLTSVGYISGVTTELAPEELKTMYPDLFMDTEDKYFNDKYEEGDIGLAELRGNLDKLNDKSLFRGSSSKYFKSVLTIPDLEDYFKSFPPIIDRILDNGYSVLKDEKVVLDTHDKIKELAIKIIETNIENKDYYGLPVDINGVLQIYNSLGYKCKIYNSYHDNDFKITDLNINYDVLNEFNHKYPGLLTAYGYYSNGNLSDTFASYLKDKNSYDLNSLEAFENEFKSYLEYLIHNDSYTLKKLSVNYSEYFYKLLPDRFLSKEDYLKIADILKDVNDRVFGTEYVYGKIIDALANDFDAYYSLKEKYPEIAMMIEPKLKEFTFKDGNSSFKLLYSRIGLKPLLNLINLYGITNIENAMCKQSSVTNKIYDMTEDNYLDIFATHIYETLIPLRIVDLNNLPDYFKEKYSFIYLPENAPEDLKEIYYKGNMEDTRYTYTSPFNFSLFHDHPDWMPFIKETKFLFNGTYLEKPLFNEMIHVFDEDEAYKFLVDYGHIIFSNISSYISYGINSKDDFYKFIFSIIRKNILNTDICFNDLPKEFKEYAKDLYLPLDAPKELQDKYYAKMLSTYDFTEHPEYLSYFYDTVLGAGFNSKYSWIIDLYPKDNIKQYKILNAAEKISDDSLISILKNYLNEHKDTFDVNKIDLLVKLLTKLSFTNSTEMFVFRTTLATQLLETDDPLKNLEKIEDIFIKNNLPITGKVYSVFKILHPELKGFDFNKLSSKYSPQLLNRTTRSKEIMIFSDLIKCAVGSNNRSLKEYIKILKDGNKIYEDICNGIMSFDALSDEEYNILISFYEHLNMLYNNSLIGKNNSAEFGSDIIQNISKLKMLLSPEKGMNYNLADRCVEMFCHFAGFDTVEELEKAINDANISADIKHRKDTVLHEPVTLRKGDFVKGIGNVEFLGRILQNGSVSKEFLGPSAGSDATPLDTDLSLVKEDGTISEGIGSSISNTYGPIWFVLRNDDRFIDSRPLGMQADTKYDPSKYECFSTLSTYHYGIRTGFASSDIDYIVVKDTLDDRIALEIVMNGFYIPVVNFEGKVLFTPKMYDDLKEKMQGLSFFEHNDYKFSSTIDNPEVREIANMVHENNKATRYKRIKIEKAIGEVLSSFGISLKTKIDGDLTEGSAELIDTGSTSRGTNKIGEGDFDFMFRLDRSLFFDHYKLDEIKQALQAKFESYGPIDDPEKTGSGDFRFKGVTIEDVKVDIDLSFDVKNDKITYSTDRCLQDRLETIEKVDSEKYTLVCANIILAKKVLKEAGVYKSSHSKPAQGGLGGVGVENWILQHGGSFEEAARSFLEAAENTSFEDFVKKYQVFDFGENHFSAKNGYYSHDNFVRNNMNSTGYEKMKIALQNYLNRNKIEVETIEPSEENIEDFNFDNITGGRS